MAAFKASFIEQVGNVARGLYAESGVEFRVCGAAASKVARDPTLREATSWPSLLPAMEGEGLPLGQALAIPPLLAGHLCDPAKCKSEPCTSLEQRRAEDMVEWPKEMEVAEQVGTARARACPDTVDTSCVAAAAAAARAWAGKAAAAAAAAPRAGSSGGGRVSAR